MEAQQQVLSKISTLESEIVSYKSHIANLKAELTSGRSNEEFDSLPLHLKVKRD